MASSAVVSPRSMPRSVRSKISSTRGIFRLTRLRLTRSITAGAAKAGWALSGGAEMQESGSSAVLRHLIMRTSSP